MGAEQSPLRVLDLTDELAFRGARLLVGPGADVLRIDPGTDLAPAAKNALACREALGAGGRGKPGSTSWRAAPTSFWKAGPWRGCAGCGPTGLAALATKGVTE